MIFEGRMHRNGVHRKFRIRIPFFKISTNNYVLYDLYTELGRYPLFVEQHLRSIIYWFKLSRDESSNFILRIIYHQMRNCTDNEIKKFIWTSKVKNQLERNGFTEVLQYPGSVDVNLFSQVLKNKINRHIHIRVKRMY